MIVGYVLALTVAGSGNASVFFKVLAFLPPTAPFAMPVLVALGATQWWGFAISVAVTIASTFVVARVAAAVYRRAVLRTGGRVRLRAVLSR
jgi:ABC-2 type transport system permease protein